MFFLLKQNEMKKSLLIFISILMSVLLYAQGIYNNGARIVSQPGSYWVIANGNFTLTSQNGTNPATFGNLKINAGGTLALNSSSYLSVTGKWQNDGNFTGQSGSTIILNGSSPQEIGGAVPTTFCNLKLSNASGFALSNSIATTGTLDFQNGIVTTGSTNGVTIGASGNASNGSPSSYIDGKLSQTFNSAGSRSFPIGKGGYYRPVTFQYSALTGTSIVTAEQFESPLSGALPQNTTLLTTNRRWTISQSGGSDFQYYITLDATGYTPSLPVVLLKQDAGTVLSYPTTAPDYTNSVPLNTLSDFGLGELCENPTDGGTIASGQQGCPGFDPALIDCSSPAGYAGTLEYKWQFSTSGSGSGFIDIEPSNFESYDPGPLSITTWYRRLARVTCKSDWSGAAVSNAAEMIVNMNPVVTISGNNTACEGDIVTYTASVTNGGTNDIYHWFVNGIPADSTFLLTGLVAYYPFTGSADDASGNGNDGIVQGASLTTDRFGNPSCAYSFNGIDNYIQVPDSPELNPSSLSLSFWIKPEGLGCYQTFIAKGGNNFEFPGITAQYDAYYCGLFRYMSADYPEPNFQFSSNNPLSNNVWQHLVLTHTGTTVQLYVNGVLENEKNTGHSLAPPTTQDLYIGNEKSLWHNMFYHGVMDDISVYNRALSGSEIEALYNSMPGTSTFYYTPSDNDIVTCEVVTGQGCTGTSNAITMTVNPVPQVTISGNSIACQGDVVTYTANVTNGGANPNYQWFVNGSPVTTSPCGSTLPSGLIAYYPFNGNAYDASGYGQNGSVGGAVLTSDRFGNASSAYAFNGAGNYVGVPVNINYSVLPQLTMVAWVKPAASSPIQTIISHDNCCFDREMCIDYRSGNTGYSAFTGFGVMGSFPVETDHFDMITVEYDQNNQSAKLYKNLSFITAPTSFSLGHNFTWIGGNPDYGEYFNGTIDDVQFYNRLLGDEEIASLYNSSGGPSFCYIPSNNDVVTCRVLSGEGCTGYSNAITMTVNPGFDPGAVDGNKTIGFGASTGTLNLLDYQGAILNWQKRVNNDLYSVIPNTEGMESYSEVPDTTGTWNYRAEVNNGTCASRFSDLATVYVEPVNRTINLNLFLEGLFNPPLGQMNKAQDEYGDKYPGTVADKIQLRLARPDYPYSVYYTKDEIELNQDGSCSFTIPRVGLYYFVVKHRNSIETWSANPVDLSSEPVSYDFTNSSSQAYGDNMREFSGIWAIWGGDVNQDGIVDGGDMNPVDNATTAITFGYVAEDVNGDGIVDGGDMNIVDNNNTSIIMAIVP
jgi:hypothetical protein